jgi:hypothetical protein
MDTNETQIKNIRENPCVSAVRTLGVLSVLGLNPARQAGASQIVTI